MSDESTADLPMVCELQPAPEPLAVFQKLANLPSPLFLDSAAVHPQRGRYSYVAADPFAFYAWPIGDLEVWPSLERLHRSCESRQRSELPPFQGGLAGLFSYELGRSIERLPAPRIDEFSLPAAALGHYDVVVSFDHLQNRAWVVSQGWPELTPEARRRRASERLDLFLQQLRATASESISPAVPIMAIADQHELPEAGGLLSNFTADGYCAAVRQAIEYIRAGEIFQVNLAQRLLMPARTSSSLLYADLRRRNPAPFAGYFDLGTAQIISASPERFLRVHDRIVETRPIKGTRPRRLGVEADLYAGDDLRGSEKDRAENIMIVDLMRNDLSRVCLPDSVRVTQLCEVETYEYVQHLVSAVEGELRPDCSSIDLLRATFPGGSITGAPKIRAMEIIAELEPHARGAYCGSLGYINWDGSLDLSILIRTITAAGGWWQLPVGGGIVAQSSPQREYFETWHKAEGLLRGIGLR
jgi:para-aminobenzoate synthetase component 1